VAARVELRDARVRTIELLFELGEEDLLLLVDD